MAITPNPFSIQPNQTQELTSTIASAIWSIVSGAGSLGAGSTAYKKIFTPTAAGSVSVRARTSIWTGAAKSAQLEVQADDSLLVNGTGTYDAYGTALRLTADGDYIEFQQNNTLLIILSRVGIDPGYDGFAFYYSFGVYSPGVGKIADVPANGTLVRLQRSGANLSIYYNGVFQQNFPTAISGHLRFGLQSQAANGSIIQPPAFGGAGISGITIETASGTVADTTRPSDVTGLTIDQNFNINSDAATDNVGVDHYRTQYKDNNGSWADFASTAKQFVGNQNLLTTVGTHTRSIRRKAVDAAGNESLNWSNEASVQYVVLPPPPPTVSISTPADGATVSGTIAITATGNDITSVQFAVGGTPLGAADNSAPFTVNLDTTTLANGGHIVSATATNGQTSAQASVIINVQNALAPIGGVFDVLEIARPFYHSDPMKDWKAVTRSKEMEDGKPKFNELSDTPPVRWKLIYTGLDAAQAAAFDAHADTYRVSRPFTFIDKYGASWSNVYYESEITKTHDGNKSWFKTREINLIKY